MAALKELWALQQRHLAGHPRETKELHYLRKHLEFEPAVRRHLRALDRMMPYLRGRVLEWGCRHAPDAAVLRMRLGWKVELHGADIREGGLFEPFHRFSDLRYRRLTDPVALPYPDRYFDAVVGHGVLEHVPDPEASLGELHRVLVSGGTLLIDALPNRFSYIEAWHRHTGGPAHERRFSLREITGMLERHGFRVVRGRRVEMLPMMLSGFGPRARRAYERANGLVASGNRLLGHRPLNVLATSLAIAALREN